MKARFTRTAARVEIAVGVLIILLGLVGAGIVLSGWDEPGGVRVPTREELLVRLGIGAVLLIAAVALGGACIVAGQLMLVFLEMQRRLARIDRRLDRWEVSTHHESPLTERLRPR
jgi:hypothetical protein